MSLSLSVEQKKVVDHEEGAIIVLAGPGSGKTRVLTERIRRLISKHHEHFRVLALTFTNKAANEMTTRLSEIEGVEKRVLISTMHGFCIEVLANRGKSVGIEGLPHIFDSYSDRKQILYDAISSDSELSDKIKNLVDRKEREHYLEVMLGKISEFKNALLVPESILDEEERLIYELYNSALRACGAVDFDDLLLLTYRLFEERPAIASFYRRQYRYICIDEAQDLNEAQYRVLCALAGKDFFNLMMVGDPKQAIFTWNGSDPKYLELFVKDFAAVTAELTHNFRSSQSVIDAAISLDPNYIVSDSFPIKGAVTIKKLSTPEDEALYVVQEIEGLIKNGHSDIEGAISYDRIGILGRNKFVFNALEDLLKQRSIKYYKKFSSGVAESASDLVSEFELALRILANPLDRVHLKLLMKKWDITEDIESVYNSPDLRKLSGSAILTALSAKSKRDNAKIITLAIEALQKSASQIKFLAALKIIEDSTITFEDDIRLLVVKDVEELRHNWDYFVRNSHGANHNLSEFLIQRALGMTQHPQRDGIGLLTVHSSKGMEFDIVFLIGMTEGTFPDFRARDAKALKEEFRSAFVAVTRSKRLLYLTYFQTKLMPWGDLKNQSASRFIGIIDRAT